MDYSNIEFGEISGEDEARKKPHLIEDGFFDYDMALQKIEGGDISLILGFKGSGKSLLAEKLKIEISKSPNGVFALQNLGDFPFHDFDTIYSCNSQDQSRYPKTWSWILILVILDILRKNNCINGQGNNIEKSINSLEKLGLLPVSDIHTLVLLSSKQETQVNLSKCFVKKDTDELSYKTRDMCFLFILKSLMNIINSIKIDKDIYLVIDGLDEILIDEDIQFKSIAALISESNRLNKQFSDNGKKIFITILCRTDIFETLPHPNKNKMRHGSSLELLWFHDPRNPGNSKLTEIANKRAALILGKGIDIFSEYFPKDFDKKTTMLEFMLDNTRHTPRDFLKLLTILKKYFNKDIFKKEEIQSGLREYSVNYFLPEIKDEMVGYAAEIEVDRFFELFSQSKLYEMDYTKLRMLANANSIQTRTLDTILKHLFMCSAIGNIWNNKFEFRYRRNSARFDPNKTIRLHKGLWKALNLV